MVEILPSPGAVMAAAAERFVEAAARATGARERFLVALSGGSTPEQLYRLLASEPYRSRVDWSRVRVFWGDERCVPPDDAASNYRMARQALLDNIPIPAANVHRIRGEAEPAVAAREYEDVLREQLGIADGPPRPDAGLDLVLLGLGPDGHTASLFPGSPALLERERWCLATEGPVAPHGRVTLTPVVLRTAGALLFLVTGSDKAVVLRRVLGDGPGSEREPTRAVQDRPGAVQWLVDSAAAAGLAGTGSESA